MATRYKRSPTTYFGSPLADTVASGGSPSFSAKKRNKSARNRPFQDVSFAVKQIGLIRKESRREGPQASEWSRTIHKHELEAEGYAE